MTEVVYFIRDTVTGHVKVGTTTNLRTRLASLQTGNAHPLRVERTVPGGLELERALHHRWRHWRLEGEWFRSNPGLERYIRTSGSAWGHEGGRGLRAPRWVGAVPVGAWRILTTVVAAALSRKVRRRRSTKRTMTTVLTGTGAGVMAYAGLPEMAALAVIAAVALAACLAEGLAR